MKRYDCIVVGAGSAGAVAAIAAGRMGASVLALEKNSYPGGTHTGGFVGGYYLQAATGILAELDGTPCPGMSPAEAKKHALEEALLEAGVELGYETVVTGVLRDGDRITGIRWRDREGHSCAAAAGTVIDATGEAVVCRMAGCRLFGGRSSDGLFQPFTNTMASAPGGPRLWASNFDAGRIDQTRDPAFSRTLQETALVHLHDDYGAHRALLTPSELPGIREGLHVETEEVFTLAALLERPLDVPEPIFYARTNIDTHANDLALESELFQEWMIGCSMWGVELGIPVPFRTIFPKNCRGLLAAGRHFGVDHDLGHALRMIACMEALGQAAGMVAALAARRGCMPEKIAYAELRPLLKLDSTPLAGNAAVWGLTAAEIRAGLDSDRCGCALWSAKRRVPPERLREWYDQASPGSHLRRHAAFALALKRDPYGIAELRTMVRERDAFAPAHSRKYNHQRGYVAVFYLGLLADAGAIDLIADLLGHTGEKSYEYRSHALMALLRIGRALPATRGRIGPLVAGVLEDEPWRLDARLKGTVADLKRMDPLFRIAAAAEFDRWQLPHRIGATLRRLPLDATERALAQRRGLLP